MLQQASMNIFYQVKSQKKRTKYLNNGQNLLRTQVPGGKAESLDIKNIAGIFVLLVMGLVLALVIAIAERLLYGFT